jgi:hypothetical protein
MLIRVVARCVCAAWVGVIEAGSIYIPARAFLFAGSDDRLVLLP